MLQCLQDILNSMLLSESVYRAYSNGPEAAVAAFREFEKGFPPGLITVQKIQCSLPHVPHRQVALSLTGVRVPCSSLIKMVPVIGAGTWWQPLTTPCMLHSWAPRLPATSCRMQIMCRQPSGQLCPPQQWRYCACHLSCHCLPRPAPADLAASSS